MTRRTSTPLLALSLFLASAAIAQDLPDGPPGSHAAYRKFAMVHQGDAEAGKLLFNDVKKLACSNCHTADGKGGKAGPDLFAIGEKFGRDDLIEQILEPSKTIAVGYSTTVIRTKKGNTFDGIVTETSDDAIGLMRADGTLTRIKNGDIDVKRTTDKSLMPEGLEKALTEEQFANLVCYLTTLKAPRTTTTEFAGMPLEIPSLKTPVPLPQINSPGNAFKHPTWCSAIPGLADSFIVTEHETGTIWLYRKTASEETKTPFLETGRNEMGASGVIGFCFHPNFVENHKYYVVKHTTDGKGFATRILQGVASADSRSDSDAPLKEIFTIHSITNDHPGGSLAFGPDDGCLYVGMGDSGPHNDPNGNGQNMSVHQGKIHRIDVEHPDEGKGYSVPKDNPFVNKPGVKPEIWAYGLREPWRFSFDPVTHDFWVADIGQDLYEEIDIVHKGENYGWNVMEGFERFSNKYRREGETFTPPLFSYTRKYGQSITGGFVYRANPKSSFYGAYIFADYQQKRVFALTRKDGKLDQARVLAVCPQSVVSIGQDASGEMILIGYEGNLYKLDLASSKWE